MVSEPRCTAWLAAAKRQAEAEQRRAAAKRREQDRQNAKRRAEYRAIPAAVRDRVETFRALNPLWSATDTAGRLGVDPDIIRAVWARQDQLTAEARDA